MPQFNLNGHWSVQSAGLDNLVVSHPTAPYTVELNSTAEYVLVVEKLGADGVHSGQVFPIVRFNDGSGQWEVFVTENARPCNGYSPLLLEGARKSAQNPQGNITTDGLPLTLIGTGYSNSARIQGLLLTGVCIVANGVDIPVKAGAMNPRWVTLYEFSRNSTDMMVKSVLFDFLMQVVKVG